jgi:glycosyltransferase involved in cell wall biosynthesis
MDKIKISICIPAYKRVNYLRRLLDSIAIQTFRDFEVIITDDSDDLSVKELSYLYKDKFQLCYHKNIKTLEHLQTGIQEFHLQKENG